MSVTIDELYNKLMELTELSDSNFKEIRQRLDRIDRRLTRLDERVDNFIEEVIDMKRNLRRPA